MWWRDAGRFVKAQLAVCLYIRFYLQGVERGRVREMCTAIKMEINSTSSDGQQQHVKLETAASISVGWSHVRRSSGNWVHLNID